jgi:hypothetical protein
MIGWVITFFIPGFISLIIVSLYTNKKRAIKACRNFQDRIFINEQLFQRSTKLIVEHKLYDYKDEIIDAKTKLYLISNVNSKTIMYSINNKGNYIFSKSKYENLLFRLSSKQVIYSYTIDSFSLYYKLCEPYENYILKIDYPQNILEPKSIRS